MGRCFRLCRWGETTSLNGDHQRTYCSSPRWYMSVESVVEWYWQAKKENLGEEPFPVPLCPPKIPLGLTRARTRASAVRDRRLTAWAMAQQLLHLHKWSLVSWKITGMPKSFIWILILLTKLLSIVIVRNFEVMLGQMLFHSVQITN
jgi:hypothetical protein